MGRKSADSILAELAIKALFGLFKIIFEVISDSISTHKKQKAINKFGQKTIENLESGSLPEYLCNHLTPPTDMKQYKVGYLYYLFYKGKYNEPKLSTLELRNLLFQMNYIELIPNSTSPTHYKDLTNGWLSHKNLMLLLSNDAVTKINLLEEHYNERMKNSDNAPELLNNKRSTNEQFWNNRFDEIINFYIQNNKFPSRKSQNKDERKLAEWVKSQRLRSRNKTLSKNEEELLISINFFSSATDEEFINDFILRYNKSNAA